MTEQTGQSADPPRQEGFMYEVCKRDGQIKWLFQISSIGAGLMLIWLAFAIGISSLRPGMGSFVVAVMTLVLMTFFLIFSGYLVRRCARLQQQREAAYRTMRNS